MPADTELLGVNEIPGPARRTVVRLEFEFEI